MSQDQHCNHVQPRRERRIVHSLSYLLLAFLLLVLPGVSARQAEAAELELNWDYLTPHGSDRDLNTVSLHVLEKIAEKGNRSVYRGLTITRAYGSIFFEQQKRDSPGTGIGPTFLIRNQKPLSDKWSAAFDMSGGFMIYDRSFPAGGRWYNFMWRVGPQFIYKINADTSVNLGYTLMHVSNGLQSRNPGYDAHGISFGVSGKF